MNNQATNLQVNQTLEKLHKVAFQCLYQKIPRFCLKSAFFNCKQRRDKTTLDKHLQRQTYSYCCMVLIRDQFWFKFLFCELKTIVIALRLSCLQMVLKLKKLEMILMVFVQMIRMEMLLIELVFRMMGACGNSVLHPKNRKPLALYLSV